MTRIVRSILLDGDLETVWGFITNPENFSRYVNGYANGKPVSPNKTGVDAQYEWYGKVGPFKLKSIEKVVEWHNRKRVAYSGKMSGTPFNSSMDVKKMKKQTRVMVSIEYKVPWYLGGVITDLLLIRRIVRDQVKKSLDALKEMH